MCTRYIEGKQINAVFVCLFGSGDYEGSKWYSKLILPPLHGCTHTAVTKMAVAWRRHHRPTLETQVWHVLQVEGVEYIFKSLFSEDGYELLIVGGMCEVGEGQWAGLVCGEKMEGAEVTRRSKVSGRGSGGFLYYL